jgi:HEPN domain-containing protein
MAEVNRKIEDGYYLFTDIKREGILLHDTGRYKLARRRKLDPVKRWQTAKEDFQFWFKKAKDFFDDYQTNIERKRYSQTAFMLHQSAEQAYNAVLLVFIGHKPKMHNLTKLGRKAGNADPAFFTIFPKDTKEQKRLFNLLRDAYVDARYRKSYQIKEEELRTLAGRVSALHELTDRVCREKIEQLARECDGAG